MSRFSAARRLSKGLNVDTSTARQLIDDMSSVAARKGDDYVREIIQQPQRAAEAQARGYRALGGGALGGGALTGGGLAYKGHVDRQAAARAAETEEEKLSIISDVLNDPGVNSDDKADILDALNDAGVFNDPESSESLWESFFGSSDRQGGSLASSLNPVQALGGGFGGWILTLVLIWAVIQVWEGR